MKPAVLYISYDGMLEPLGQSQVVSYLEGLSADHRLYLISYEKPGDWSDLVRRRHLEDRLKAAGIAWTPLRYHKTPTLPATAFDLLQGTLAGLWLTMRHRVRLIHARSYLPGLMGRVISTLTGARLLFDMRGLWADERADGGFWPREGWMYRGIKALEKHLLTHADHVVTLTQNSRREILTFAAMKGRENRITVIPTCADLDRFTRPQAPPERLVLGYLGSIGPWYMFDKAAALFRRLLAARADAEFLIVNRSQQDVARRMLVEAGLPLDRCRIVSADHRDVPQLVAAMSCGTALMRPSYAEKGRAPTKLAEFLGCGVPCVGNVGIGDVAEILSNDRVGVVMQDFSDDELDRAAEQVLALVRDPDVAARCRTTAERMFSLVKGTDAYRAIYRSVLA